MATGDILDITIRDDGWSADVTFEGMAAGGTYDFGFDLENKNKVDTAKMILSLTSVGYDSAGIADTKSRNVYCTKQVRKPYPNQTDMEETVVGSNLVVRVALSDYIYGDCTDITAVCAVGIYNDGTNVSASSNVPVTNNSTASHQKVVANWSLPGWREVEEDGSLKLSCVAFHQSATAGNCGISAIKFTVSDEHSNYVTPKVVTTPIATIGNKTSLAVIEFVVNFTALELSGLKAGDQLACDFIAYPHIGDSGAILDTSDGVNAGLTPLYNTQYNYLPSTTGDDRYYAYVKTGSTGGAVSIDASTAELTPFATISAANNAIVSAHGVNADRGVIRISNLEGQVHVWTGGTSNNGSNHKTWLTVETWDESANGSKAIISGATTSEWDLSKFTKIHNCEVVAITSLMFAYLSAIWYIDCDLDQNGQSAPATLIDLIYITGCSVSGRSWQSNHGGSVYQVHLSRDNVGDGGQQIYTALGNRFTSYVTEGNSTANDTYDGAIFAFNKIKVNAGETMDFCDNNSTYPFGFVFVQNEVEHTPLATEATLMINAMTKTGPVYNAIVWHNTGVGQRWNLFYNSEGDVAVNTLYVSYGGNCVYSYNFKTDTFTPPSAARIGNWSEGYGVGYFGNYDARNNGTDDNFWNSKDGQMAGFDGLGYAYGDISDLAFVDYTAGVGGSGGGDYHILAGSSAMDLITDNVLPYDLDGVARTSGTAGAYEFVIATAYFKYAILHFATGEPEEILTADELVLHLATGQPEQEFTEENIILHAAN